MALFYAGGTHIVNHAKPASAFSKGDLLELNSGSSLSYADQLHVAGQILAGVALSSSTESVQDKVPYLVAHPDTKFWITATAANAGAASRFVNYDITPASGDHELAAGSQLSSIALVWSTSSEDASIVKRDADSADSWVIISIVSGPVAGSLAVG